jgi:hypothetical protein
MVRVGGSSRGGRSAENSQSIIAVKVMGRPLKPAATGHGDSWAQDKGGRESAPERRVFRPFPRGRTNLGPVGR